MKRAFSFFLICLTIFIIYYDLSSGTLPPGENSRASEPPKAVPVDTAAAIPYTETVASPGDTLLSLVEKESGSLQIPAEEAIADFERLNGIPPESMQIGKTYKIPLYKE